MAEDIVKANDDEFLEQTTMFHTFINANPTAYGFTQDEVDELRNKNQTFGTSLGDFNTKQTATRAARQQKDIDREPDEEQFRWMVKQFNSRPNVTNADRINAAVPPKSEAVGSIIADLSNPPLLLVEQSGVHEHRIKFFMPSEDSDSTKKPQGIDFVQIFQKIGGEASTNLKDYQLVAFDRKSPYSYTHDATDVGKTAHYIGVWATDEDLKSTQSEVFSLTIT
ncbi:hypothetical protein BH10ACI1_BH10ACI1_02960 [soil metagenome]